MKIINYEQFASFNPCWLTDEDKREKHAEQLARYRAMRDEWTALDILRLDDVSAQDRLWLVLREELIDAHVLHEFSRRCAERAAMDAAWAVSWDSASIAACAASSVARSAEIAEASPAAWAAAWANEREWQVAELIRLLEGENDG